MADAPATVDAEPLNLALYERERGERGAQFGTPAHFAPSTRSTNDDALAAARSGAAHGSLFAATHQTAGRGRRGRGWCAPPGSGLLFSLVLRPHAPAIDVPRLTLAVGLGVRAALEPHADRRLTLEWPNDVMAGSAKLSGVLCEGMARGDSIEAVVVGVGINWRFIQLPESADRRAISVEELAPGALPSREVLLASAVREIERRVEPCLRGDRRQLFREFEQHDGLRGREVIVEASPPLTGTACGIDADGRLLVDAGGQRRAVQSGSVRVR